MKRFLFLLIFIPLLLIIIAFTYRNAQSVELDLLVVHYQLPLAIVMLFTLLLGGVLGFLLNMAVLLGCKRENSKLKKQQKALAGADSVK